MKPRSDAFAAEADIALADGNLQRSLGKFKTRYMGAIADARRRLPEFGVLAREARTIKETTLRHLDLYLEEFERKVANHGGKVHWAETADAANAIILDICRKAGARLVTKGKSMVSEETALNAALETGGLRVVETDLGEYLIQLRKEAPSHIIAPAVHLTKQQVEADFRRAHASLPAERRLEEPGELVAEARQVLRETFVAADVGITGANFLVAETGTAVIVTNEGNGDLTRTLPRVHIVLASIEKVVPTLEDLGTLLRVLARSATGQEISTYTTLMTGPRRPGDPDGPDAFHVVLLDGGRSELLGSEFHDVLRCIRCGACMDHCPVYHAVGGHPYGWVYPGPIGAVLTPALVGIGTTAHLPNASSFCGRCEEVCPMSIPLPMLMRHWREREFEMARARGGTRRLLRAWAWLASRPGLYHWAAGIGIGLLARLGRRGRMPKLPGLGGWLTHREFPAPEGGTFQAQWAERQRRR